MNNLISILTLLPSGSTGVLAGGRGVAIDPVRVLVALGIALLLAWIAALLLARLRRGKGIGNLFPGKATGEMLKVQEARRIGVNADVCLVEWGAKQYLIGVTAGGMTVLDSRETAASAAARPDDSEAGQ